MTDETHIAVGELVQAAAHQHGIVGPVPFTVSRPKHYEWCGLEDDYENKEKTMTKEELMIAAKEFLADHDYAESHEGLTYEAPAGFEAQMLIEHFAQFAYEMIDMEEDRIRCDERLLSERLSAAAFKDGFSMIKGIDCWIGSDGCEYDSPLEYAHNGSPEAGKRSFMLEG